MLFPKIISCQNNRVEKLKTVHANACIEGLRSSCHGEEWVYRSNSTSTLLNLLVVSLQRHYFLTVENCEDNVIANKHQPEAKFMLTLTADLNECFFNYCTIFDRQNRVRLRIGNTAGKSGNVLFDLY